MKKDVLVVALTATILEFLFLVMWYGEGWGGSELFSWIFLSFFLLTVIFSIIFFVTKSVIPWGLMLIMGIFGAVYLLLSNNIMWLAFLTGMLIFLNILRMYSSFKSGNIKLFK